MLRIHYNKDGMDEEGEKSLEVQAQMEELFSKLGLTVYKQNGQIKNTYELMKDLAGVYPTLTTAQKAYVTVRDIIKYLRCVRIVICVGHTFKTSNS